MTMDGQMLGHYRVAARIGEGGMGVVYRGRDTRLNRDVAIKVLPQGFAEDSYRMARFEREAQLLASLNHPKIAGIYGLEVSGATRALVMELVEGPTLAERIGKVSPSARPRAGSASPAQAAAAGSGGKTGEGKSASGGARKAAIPLDEALPIAQQMAEALEYAHEHGIVHRDLKPANVKITPEGDVKVLDFGLAKAMGPDEASADISNSPTLSAAMTQEGFIIGTAAYMAPEQAKGRPVDRRADIWAFGCVLYEMLTGKKAFEGETVSDVLAAVIMKEPDWAALPDATPAVIQKLLRRCLAKDLRHRLQAIGEARIAIEEYLANPDDASVVMSAAVAPAPSFWRRLLPWGAAGLLAVVLIAVVFLRKSSAPAAQLSPVLASILPPTNQSLRQGSPAISPDGKQLAYSVTDENGESKLYVRPLDSNGAKAIAGTDDAGFPFWSPDGGSLGFFAGGKLKTVSLANGNVQVLTDALCWTNDGAWSPGGTILYTPNCDSPLDKISASGGNPAPATKLHKGMVDDGRPAFLPDGRHFLFVPDALIPNPTHSIWMGSLDSSEEKLVLKNAAMPRFASGHILFTRDNRVFAQPFDPATGKVSGKAVALAPALSYSVSDSGVLAYKGGTSQGRLEWFDRNGSSLGSVGPVALYLGARISPDGKRVLADVVDLQSLSSDILSYPAAGGPGTRLTFGPGLKMFPVWSPDGKFFAYSLARPPFVSATSLYRKPADGSGAAQRLATLDTPYAQVTDWSADGRYLAIQEVGKENQFQVWVLPLFGDRKPFRPAPVNAQQAQGSFSPDGRWLAYNSYESGRPEVYVVSFPGLGAKYQISQNGGNAPLWDRKGNLYFKTLGGRLMEAELETSGKSLQVKSLHPLFQLSPPSLPIAWNDFYNVSGDGIRFLAVQSTNPTASRSIGLLLNWQSKLKGKP